MVAWPWLEIGSQGDKKERNTTNKKILLPYYDCCFSIQNDEENVMEALVRINDVRTYL